MNLCYMLFGTEKIESKAQAQCVALNNKKLNLISHFYSELLKKGSYDVFLEKNGKELIPNSELALDSLVYLRDVDICDLIPKEENNKLIYTFIINSDISFFRNFYNKKFEDLQSKINAAKTSEDEELFNSLLVELKKYEKYFK